MTEAISTIGERARELRRDFDRSFASPPVGGSAGMTDLLAIRLGTSNLAVRLAEIAGLFVDKPTTPVPGSSAALVGITGFRGTIVPVYDLQQLIGQSKSPSARWLFLAAAAPIAFAFEFFAGQLRVPSDAIKPQQADAKQGFAHDFVRTDGVLRPILELKSVIATIKN